MNDSCSVLSATRFKILVRGNKASILIKSIRFGLYRNWARVKYYGVT